jgi:hypothetical protein
MPLLGVLLYLYSRLGRVCSIRVEDFLSRSPGQNLHKFRFSKGSGRGLIAQLFVLGHKVLAKTIGLLIN